PRSQRKSAGACWQTPPMQTSTVQNTPSSAQGTLSSRVYTQRDATGSQKSSVHGLPSSQAPSPGAHGRPGRVVDVVVVVDVVEVVVDVVVSSTTVVVVSSGKLVVVVDGSSSAGGVSCFGAADAAVASTSARIDSHIACDS